MAVVATDFERPTGELNPDWFRDDDMTLMADAQIVAAAALTPNEALQREFVYAQLYAALARDLMIEPALQREGDAWEEFSSKQLAFFQNESRKHLAAFNLGMNIDSGVRSRVRNLVPTF